MLSQLLQSICLSCLEATEPARAGLGFKPTGLGPEPCSRSLSSYD